MRSASYRISAPSTVQYHSIISRRRLVCSTICDSFDGLAILFLPPRVGHDSAKSGLKARHRMRVIDLSMTLSEWDHNSFAPQETYFRLRPIVGWDDKGFV